MAKESLEKQSGKYNGIKLISEKKTCGPGILVNP